MSYVQFVQSRLFQPVHGRYIFRPNLISHVRAKFFTLPPNKGNTFSHITADGDLKMVDITEKQKDMSLLERQDMRIACAEATVCMSPATMERLLTYRPPNDDLRQPKVEKQQQSIESVLATEARRLGSELVIKAPKGDVYATAKIAGIMGAKKTAELIPLCHQIALSHISVDLVPVPRGLHITTIVRASAGQATGVEMEALTAASIAALTVYDMCKAVQPGTICIESLRLVKKCGGSSS